MWEQQQLEYAERIDKERKAIEKELRGENDRQPVRRMPRALHLQGKE